MPPSPLNSLVYRGHITASMAPQGLYIFHLYIPQSAQCSVGTQTGLLFAAASDVAQACTCPSSKM